MASAALNSSTVGTYLYNGLEQRVAKAVSSTTTHYVLDDDGHVLSEDDASGNPIREYIWMGDMPVALVDRTGMSPAMYFIHTDHLNRPQKLTDGSATLVWDAVFQPFGEAYSVSGSATNLLMFPGQFYDSETTLSQNWHRDYDATLGRYIQSDPIGLAGGINTYLYTWNDPMKLTDPRGTDPILGVVVGTISGGLYGGVGAYAAGGNWQTITASVIIGAATGAVIGTLDPTLGIGTLAFYGGAAGGIGDLVGQGLTNFASGKSVYCNINVGSAIGATLGGALGGAGSAALSKFAIGAVRTRLSETAVTAGASSITGGPGVFLTATGSALWNNFAPSY